MDEVTYKNRIISGKKIDRRSKMGDMKKYRPDKFYHNSEDRYFKTTGDVLKQNKENNDKISTVNKDLFNRTFEDEVLFQKLFKLATKI